MERIILYQLYRDCLILRYWSFSMILFSILIQLMYYCIQFSMFCIYVGMYMRTIYAQYMKSMNTNAVWHNRRASIYKKKYVQTHLICNSSLTTLYNLPICEIIYIICLFICLHHKKYATIISSFLCYYNYLCMYVCMYACLHVCMYVCKFFLSIFYICFCIIFD